jgi:hypothetical protein
MRCSGFPSTMSGGGGGCLLSSKIAEIDEDAPISYQFGELEDSASEAEPLFSECSETTSKCTAALERSRRRGELRGIKRKDMGGWSTLIFGLRLPTTVYIQLISTWVRGHSEQGIARVWEWWETRSPSGSSKGIYAQVIRASRLLVSSLCRCFVSHLRVSANKHHRNHALEQYYHYHPKVG